MVEMAGCASHRTRDVELDPAAADELGGGCTEPTRHRTVCGWVFRVIGRRCERLPSRLGRGATVAVRIRGGDRGHGPPVAVGVLGIPACDQRIRHHHRSQSQGARRLAQIEPEPSDEGAERPSVLCLHELRPEQRGRRLLGRSERPALRAVPPGLLEIARVPPAAQGRRRVGSELRSVPEEKRPHPRHPRRLRRRKAGGVGRHTPGAGVGANVSGSSRPSSILDAIRPAATCSPTSTPRSSAGPSGIPAREAA
jgi:hypothetical protein